MKRVLSLIMVVGMLFGVLALASCGKDVEETTTEATATEEVVSKAIDDFANKIIYVSWQLEYLKNDSIEYNNTEKDLDLIEACKKWSRQELSAFIAEILAENQNNCCYNMLCGVTAQHGFDGPFVAIATLIANGDLDIIVVDGEVCYVVA